jgi:hypothetical protein
MTSQHKLFQAAEREVERGERGWWWLSFVDTDRPEGARFLGVAIVQAYGVTTAAMLTHDMGINPGGEVAAVPIPPDLHPPPDACDRLLTRAEAEEVSRAFWSERSH